MKNSTEIVFVDPPLIDDSGNILEVKGHLPQLGMLTVAAVVRNAGYSVAYVDSVAMKYSVSDVINEIESYNPRYIGFTAMTHNISSVAYIAKIIKERRKDVKIILGGVHITSATAETYNKYPGVFDYSVIGEGEDTIIDLLECLETKKSLTNVPGIAYCEDNEICKTPSRDIINDMDRLPFPAWDLLTGMNQNVYEANFISSGKGKTNHLLTSRGCPAMCAFCDTSVNGKKIRGFTPDYVLEMMNVLVNKYNVNDIQINDDTFVSLKKRMYSICEKLIDTKLNISWSCDARVNNMTKEGVELMAEAGCWQIAYGVETGSERIMKWLQKKITFEQIERAMRWTYDAGINTKGFFILGHPTESRQTLEETVQLMLRLPLDVIGLTFFTVFPGSPCYTDIEKYGKFNGDWSLTNTYTAGNFVANNFTKDELIRLRYDALRRFYFRPKYVLRQLRHVKKDPTSFFMLSYGLVKAVEKVLLPNIGFTNNKKAPIILHQ